MPRPAEPPVTAGFEGPGNRLDGTGWHPSRAELFRAIAVGSETPGPSHSALWESLELGDPPRPSDHTELFVLQLPAHAALYLGPEGMLGGEAADRVAGFWRALSIDPPPEADHLAAILGLYAATIDAGNPDSPDDGPPLGRLGRVRCSLVWEHLLSWVPIFAIKAAEVGPAPYRAWAALLLEALLEEAAEIGAPPALPLHLRQAPPVADPCEGGQAFVGALLAPARAGIVLTRSDLARAGAELGLGVRIGERRYSLTAMLGEDPPAVLAWLGVEAARWAERAEAMIPALGAVGAWWAARARATVGMLQAAAALAEANPPGMRQPVGGS